MAVERSSGAGSVRHRVLVLLGTRPEAIKLAPVMWALEGRSDRFETLNVASGQHRELVEPFVRDLKIRVDHDLAVGRVGQTPSGVCQRTLIELEGLLEDWRPDAVLVQGDTTTALAGALAANQLGIAVGHVEAGLRSGNPMSPFPEEMNRRLITGLACFHFAATEHNRETLLAEGVDDETIAVTGNPVVDCVGWAMAEREPSDRVENLMHRLNGRRFILFTTHRRESFGEVMEARMRVLGEFVAEREDLALIFPVHPNPQVQERAERLMGESERVLRIPPLNYLDFVHLIARSWLLVSDSGGIQEEAPSLGKRLLLIRENTERPEAIESGVARLVGASPEVLREQLAEAYRGSEWVREARRLDNPFGNGTAGEQIAEALASFLDSAHPRGGDPR